MQFNLVLSALERKQYRIYVVCCVNDSLHLCYAEGQRFSLHCKLKVSYIFLMNRVNRGLMKGNSWSLLKIAILTLSFNSIVNWDSRRLYTLENFQFAILELKREFCEPYLSFLQISFFGWNEHFADLILGQQLLLHRKFSVLNHSTISSPPIK